MKTLRTVIGILTFSLLFAFTSCSVDDKAEEVVEEVTTDEPNGEIILMKNEYNPGEEIQIAYKIESETERTGNIEIVPSGAAGGNESSKMEKGFNDNVGSMTFNAPNNPGDYNIKMNTQDGNGKSKKEITSVSITVIDPDAERREIDAEIEVDKDTYSPGENIEVTFSAPSTWDRSAWIGLVPSIIDHGNERMNFKEALSKENISGRISGKITFKAPETPGVYDIRMHNSTTNGTEVEDITLTVK